MERLNDIFKRDVHQLARLRPEGEERQVRPGSLPAGTPSRRPLPEQTARIGGYPRAYQPSGFPPSPPSPPSPLAIPAPSVPATPASRSPIGHHDAFGVSHHQARTPVGRPDYQGDACYPAAGADVQHEWREEWDDEETASIRYGDWESDIYDMPPRPAISTVPTHRREQEAQPPVSRGANRIAQTLPQGSRSLVTRELRRPVDEEELPAHYSPQTRQPMQSLQAPLSPPRAVAPSIAHAQRSTQPLNRSPKMEPQPIPAPYTSPKVSCSHCKGKGYLRADVPYGHPNFGKPIACECKEQELRERRRSQLQEMSNLAELQSKRFDNFNPNVSASVRKAYLAALDYAEPSRDGWLILIGGFGCGKTHLAAAIANQALANGTSVLFSTVSDLLDHLRATFTPNATEYYDHLFQEMREAELLVLDDLGAQQSSPWANEKLFQLLNYRYNSRFPTIITTNNTGLQGIEERIRSRIMDVNLVTAIMFDQTGDYRLRNPRRE